MLILGLYSLATTAFFFLFFFSFSLDALLPMEKDPPPPSLLTVMLTLMLVSLFTVYFCHLSIFLPFCDSTRSKDIPGAPLAHGDTR